MMKRLLRIMFRFRMMMPLQSKMFFAHRVEFAEMLTAIKELEVMNRTDIASICGRLEAIEDKLGGKQDVGSSVSDVMVN